MPENAHYVRRNGEWKAGLEYVSATWLGGRVTIFYGETSCAVQVTSVKIGSGSWDGSDWGTKVKEGYRPPYEVSNPLMTANGGSHTGFLVVSPNGTISVKNMGSAGSSDTRNGSVCWPVQRQY